MVTPNGNTPGMSPNEVIRRLSGLASHLEQMDSGSGDARLMRRAAQLMAGALDIVGEQANDGRLWFDADYITEANLQTEIRRLHAAIEGVSPDDCARAALRGGE